MGDNCSHQSTDGVGEDGARGELTVVHRVKHGGVGAQEAAPAHADGGEHSDGVAIGPAFLNELGHQTEGSPDGAKGGDGEADEVGILKAEQGLEDNADLIAQPGEDADALIGSAGIDAIGAG